MNKEILLRWLAIEAGRGDGGLDTGNSTGWFFVLRRSKIVIKFPKIIIWYRVRVHSKANSLGNFIKQWKFR